MAGSPLVTMKTRKTSPRLNIKMPENVSQDINMRVYKAKCDCFLEFPE